MPTTIAPQNPQHNPITVTLEPRDLQALINLLEREEQEYGLSKPQLSALRTLQAQVSA
jgi:hypothetical protein